MGSNPNEMEQITPLAPSDALTMALAMTNYSWRFKAHTNWVVSALPTGFTTNLVARTITNRLHRVVAFTNMVVVTNGWVMATNLGRIFPASGTEFGPMAQDWHAATGLQDGHRISARARRGC